jgi:hypothetical protein
MWKVNKGRGEGFSDSFSYSGNILQQGATDWLKNDITNTAIEHSVHSKDLTHCPSIRVDERRSLCKIRKTLYSTCIIWRKQLPEASVNFLPF